MNKQKLYISFLIFFIIFLATINPQSNNSFSGTYVGIGKFKSLIATSNSKSYDQFDSKKVILEFSNTNDASSLDVIFLTNFGTIQGYTLRGEIIIINDFGKGVNFSSRTTEKDFELGAILSDNDNRMEGEFMIKYGYNKQSFYHCKFTAYRE